MDILEAIKGRRSIRKYKPTPVDDKSIELVLDAARQAPSWANTQCWRFIVVRDNETKTKLASALIGTQAGDKVYPNPAYGAVENAPVIIIVCAQLAKSGFKGDKPATDKGDYWYMYDTALAMQNLSLAAYSSGLGTVIIGAMDSVTIGNILEVPDGYCVVAMTPLGYPDQEPGPRPRKELSELTYYEKFGIIG